MTQPSPLIIRHFQKEDMPLLGELYQSVTANKHAEFWWVGDEENWENVYCAFEHGKMIAKGQISVIGLVPPGQPESERHSLFVNLKTQPEREKDADLLDLLYHCLLDRAVELQKDLPPQYRTQLCMGNDSSEAANTDFFIQKGFRHLNSLYRMIRPLSEPVPELALPEGFQFSRWRMETAAEENEYLAAETEIWPAGLHRMAEYKANQKWTSMVVRHEGVLAASVMAWLEDDHGVIEDVFVRKPWRQQGLARFLLAQGLRYLVSFGTPYASLMVETGNKSALSLYESVGFQPDREELRYFILLDEATEAGKKL